jgi:hypothetical protein
MISVNYGASTTSSPFIQPGKPTHIVFGESTRQENDSRLRYQAERISELWHATGGS